jgi:hypothetical protein
VWLKQSKKRHKRPAKTVVPAEKHDDFVVLYLEVWVNHPFSVLYLSALESVKKFQNVWPLFVSEAPKLVSEAVTQAIEVSKLLPSTPGRIKPEMALDVP